MPTIRSAFRTPPHDRTYGIEVECVLSNITESGNLSVTYDKHYGFFKAGRDGSIEHTWCNTPVEFVSQPLPREWLKKELYKLYNRFPIKENDSCGIHIHVSRKWCTEKKAKQIRKFLCALGDDQCENLFGRTPQYFCRNVDDKNSRYRMVNVQPTETVEFRMFKSGGIKWACYCVDMVDYLVRNYRTLNVDALFAFRDLHSYAFE